MVGGQLWVSGCSARSVKTQMHSFPLLPTSGCPVVCNRTPGESAEDSLRQSALANRTFGASSVALLCGASSARNIRQIVEVFDAEESEDKALQVHMCNMHGAGLVHRSLKEEREERKLSRLLELLRVLAVYRPAFLGFSARIRQLRTRIGYLGQGAAFHSWAESKKPRSTIKLRGPMAHWAFLRWNT